MSDRESSQKHTGGFITDVRQMKLELPEEIAQELSDIICEKYPNGIPTDNLSVAVSGESSIQILAWECPVHHIGIRGDVEVCPICLKEKGIEPANDHMWVFGKDEPIFIQENETLENLEEEMRKRGIE